MRILAFWWRIAVLPYLPFDIKNSPSYYCRIWFSSLPSHPPPPPPPTPPLSLSPPPILPPPFHPPRTQTPLCSINLSHPTYLPPSIHLQWNQTLLLRMNSSKAPASSSPCLHLALICSHSFLASAQFHQPEFLSSTFGAEPLSADPKAIIQR